jgi:hypothetical protein
MKTFAAQFRFQPQSIFMKTFTILRQAFFTTLHLVVFAILMSSGAQSMAQTIRYVKSGASGTGGSWADASGDFQAMITASSAGQEVWVAAGEFQPANGQSFSMKEGVKIYGGFAATGNPTQVDRNWRQYKTILRGNNSTVVRNEGNSLSTASLLDGFTVTGGRTNFDGAGIRNVGSSPTLKNLVVENNVSTVHSAGIYNNGCSPVIRESVIRNNSAAYEGGGITNERASSLMINLLITGNYAGSYGSAVRASLEGASVLINSTIAGNATGYNIGGVIDINAGATLAVKNSIVYGNNSPLKASDSYGNANMSYFDLSNSLIQGIGADAAKQLLDGGLNPLFVDAANGDYSVFSLSPVINKGSNALYTGLDGSSKDFGGNPRVYNYASSGIIDLGAYEFQGIPGPTADASGIVYVKKGAAGDGTSWNNAAGDLSRVLSEAGAAVKEIWVAAGEYSPPSGESFSMKEGVKIYGGFPASGTPAFSDRNFATNVTTLKGNGSRVITNVFNYLTRAALLDGFTITGGTTTEDGGGIRNWYASPSLYNLKIVGNQARNGGGIDNGHADILVVNTLISGNTGTNFGAAISNYASHNVTYINTTITNNTGSASFGAMANESASVIVANSIIYGNITSKGISNETDANSSVTYSLVENLAAGSAANHNMDGTAVYPNLFSNAANNDYSLNSSSAVVNMGNNDSFTQAAGSRDVAGNSRIVGGKIDLGAYESQTLPALSLRYVREGFAGNGYSWATASGDLQAMINESASGNQIWVTGGTFVPNRKMTDPGTVTPGNAENTFLLKEGVAVYGGFQGDETQLAQRNWVTHETILSGRFESGNAYHVVVAAGTPSTPLTSSTKLDGVTISGGSASNTNSSLVNTQAVYNNNGGGLYNYNSSAGFTHIKLADNYSINIGGAVFNWSSGSAFTDLTVTGNTAKSGAGIANYAGAPSFFNTRVSGNAGIWGGGYYNLEASPEIVGTQISGNTADYGGGIYNATATPVITNATISSNTGYGIYNTGTNSTLQIRNSIIFGNTDGVASGTVSYSNSLVQNVAGGTDGNLDGDIDPLFTNTPAPGLTTGGDFTLQACSWAINAGKSSFVSAISKDLSGNDRFFGSAADLGAYEYQSAIQTGANRLTVNSNNVSIQAESGKTYRVNSQTESCRSLAVIRSAGQFPVTGQVSITSWVDGTVQSFKGTPYVQRHYDIIPTTNAETATAKVTLYFTQAEFSAFNDKSPSGKLPANAEDTGGKSNLRVFQYHGGTSGQTGPSAFTGAVVSIDPADNGIVWNNALERWEVTFDITGFSGFFVGSSTSPLPVKLVSFEGKLADNQSVDLKWLVAEQEDISEYVVEYSATGRNFAEVGRVQASKNGNDTYTFRTGHPFTGAKAYYRLHILEPAADSYSRIVSVNLPEQANAIVYPMPARDIVWLKGTQLSGSEVRLIDKQGRVFKTIVMQSDEQQIDISALLPGTYLLQMPFGGVQKIVKQ